jgi:hypothetical protein
MNAALGLLTRLDSVKTGYALYVLFLPTFVFRCGCRIFTLGDPTEGASFSWRYSRYASKDTLVTAECQRSGQP